MASVRSIDAALNITLNTNGRIIRNLIHGADTVMSHILHFYHLAAADFVNIKALGSPWDDGQAGEPFGNITETLVPLTTRVEFGAGFPTLCNGGVTKELVESYVRALVIRKEAHTMGAIFSGRQPTSNAIVPGGVTTAFTAADVTDFRTRLNTVRNFINSYYIPDVVFVATRSYWTKYWGAGTNPGTLLSYGEYPSDGIPFNTVANNNMLIRRGVCTWNNTDSPTFASFNTNNITESVDNSFYVPGAALHPSVGVTTPLTATTSPTLAFALANGPQYSWLKAPRYGGVAAEVGPLARMMVTHRAGGTQLTANEIQSNSVTTFLGGTIPAAYNATDLITWTLGQANAVVGVPGLLTPKSLFSPLGRHAARALECKYVADAMYGWLDQLSISTATSDGAPTNPYTTTTAVSSGYSYVAIPKSASGEGLAEAPRGALGHWITIANKKIASYQCVVPTTWNACPGNTTIGAGPAESVLNGLNIGTNENDAILNIARMLHPYDFCIACAVHVVNPEGKEITKFEMGLDGSIKKL
jgi:hydrogenase large subunit